MLYARVEGVFQRPKKGLRGTCPCCADTVIAKCGDINAHHWAHKSNDCDPWSEGMTEWHLSWQDLIIPDDDKVEVVIGEHRADIKGNNGVIVELQHSPLEPGQIEERERFYGDMVWLFDATTRFELVECGPIAFFSYGQTKHLQKCKKPLFLDFGSTIVEVTSHTERFQHFSGYGKKRDRSWFVEQFLSDVIQCGKAVGVVKRPEYVNQSWIGKNPTQGMYFGSYWMEGRGQELLPRGTCYFPLDYEWRHPNGTDRSMAQCVIEEFPDIANGWTLKELKKMLLKTEGKAIILNGKLRVMPDRGMSDNISPASAKLFFQEADSHIAAGRLPVFRDETRKKMLTPKPAVEE